MASKIIQAFVAVLLITVTYTQDCSALEIDAIYSCTFEFASDATCTFSKCNTFSPGNPQTSTDWSTCYSGCCPGFKIPTSQTKSALGPCFDQFDSIPTVNPILSS